MLIRRATGRYKETKFYRVGTEVGFAHSTVCISRRAKPWEREGAILLSRFRRSEGEGIAQSVLETPEKFLKIVYITNANEQCAYAWAPMNNSF